MPLRVPAAATRESRLAEAIARWHAISAASSDLQPAVALQERLIRRLIDLVEALEHGRLPRLSLPPRYLAAKLARGVPALTGEPIPVPAALLTPPLKHLCDDLAAGGAGAAAERIRAALDETRIDAGSLLAASLNRDQRSIRAAAVQHDLAPDLLWLVAELAISPFAYAVQRLVFRAAPAEPQFMSALERWERGSCPACGSGPALAELLDGARVLRCSFCACGWDARRGCAYCGDEHVSTITGAGSLELCSACRSYLKVVEVTHLSPFPLLAIADLETMALDAIAMDRGFARPQLGDRHT